MQSKMAVLSFDRPDMLEQTLLSLKAQTVPLRDSDIHLFQDNFGGSLEGDQAGRLAIGQSCSIFKSTFPGGTLHLADHNLGVAFNFDRAESFMFEELQVDHAYFFEDDLILGKNYITVLNKLSRYMLEEELVAYVAAYGDHHATLEQQRRKRTAIVQMSHKWGFALTRRQWRRQRDIMAGYLDIVKENDYRARDNPRIWDYFASLGYTSPGTSQDAAKDVCSAILGTTKVMSYACFGKYIGEKGVHMTTELYQSLGYQNTEMFPDEIPDFDFPSTGQLKAYVEMERHGAKV